MLFMNILIYLILFNLMEKISSNNEKNLRKLVTYISTSKAILIGAGAGLSTSAGFYSSGERFHK